MHNLPLVICCLRLDTVLLHEAKQATLEHALLAGRDMGASGNELVQALPWPCLSLSVTHARTPLGKRGFATCTDGRKALADERTR